MSASLPWTALLRMAGRNVFRYWRASLSAGLSIAAGFVAVGLFSGFIDGLLAEFRDTFEHRFMLGQIIVQGADAALGNPNDDAFTDGNDYPGMPPPTQKVIEAFIDQHKQDITESVRMLKIGGMITNGTATTMFKGYGLDVDRGASMRGVNWRWNALAGIPLQDAQAKEPLLIGRGLASLLDCHGVGLDNSQLDVTPGSRSAPALTCVNPRAQLVSMTVNGQLNAEVADVVGIMDTGFEFLDRLWINLPLADAQRLFDTQNISMYTLALRTPSQAAKVAGDLAAFAEKQGIGLSVKPWQIHPLGRIYGRISSLLAALGWFILLVVAAIGGMAVANTFFRFVNERTREIGMLRSLGFRRIDLTALFLCEGAALSLLAVVIGFVLNIFAAIVINAFNIRYSGGIAATPIPLKISFVFPSYGLTALALCAVSTAAVLLPARRAGRLKIAEALTHV